MGECPHFIVIVVIIHTTTGAKTRNAEYKIIIQFYVTQYASL